MTTPFKPVYGHNLTKFVELNAWFRYWMLRAFLDSGLSSKTIRKRLGWRLDKLSKVLFSTDYTLSLDDLAVWFFAIDGSMLDFKLVDRDRNIFSANGEIRPVEKEESDGR